jgi:hypothetical protein
MGIVKSTLFVRSRPLIPEVLFPLLSIYREGRGRVWTIEKGVCTVSFLLPIVGSWKTTISGEGGYVDIQTR